LTGASFYGKFVHMMFKPTFLYRILMSLDRKLPEMTAIELVNAVLVTVLCIFILFFLIFS
tara:strand:- start:607 stop:786 length:180 start_codon:yes stop_codon:yes gene_type:complete